MVNILDNGTRKDNIESIFSFCRFEFNSCVSIFNQKGKLLQEPMYHHIPE